jgi:predicted ATP-grasp superfamily ATP-dependent carboligase
MSHNGPGSSSGRVLVTGGEEAGVLAAVRGLGRAGYSPWVAASDPRGYAVRSRYTQGSVIVPSAARDPSGFVAALASAAEEHRIDLVLPGREVCLRVLARNRAAFPASTVLGCPSPQAVEQATDKCALSAAAAEVGLESPETRVVNANEIPAGLRFPLIVKPQRSVVVVDGVARVVSAKRVDSEQMLRRALATLPDGVGLVQPYLEGTLVALAGVYFDGEIRAPVHMAADRTWPVDAGVIAAGRTIERNAALEAAAPALLSRLDWEGLFQLQFIRVAGRLYVIDLNPRIFLSLALATSAGANLAAVWADLLLGRRRVRVNRYRVGLRYRAEEHDARAVLHALLAPNARAVRAARPRRGTTHLVFARDDPLPFLTSFERAAKFIWNGRAARVGH